MKTKTKRRPLCVGRKRAIDGNLAAQLMQNMSIMYGDGSVFQNMCERRKLLADWDILTLQGGIEWPLTDEEFAASWKGRVMFCKWQKNRGLAVIDLECCPIEVTGWKSFVSALQWIKDEQETTGRFAWTTQLLEFLHRTLYARKDGGVRAYKEILHA